MDILSLVLLALETIAKVAVNPNLGLNGDASRIAALIGVLANLGRKGQVAAEELKNFTAEIQAMVDADVNVDPSVWDELTQRRHEQAAAIAALPDG